MYVEGRRHALKITVTMRKKSNGGLAPVGSLGGCEVGSGHFVLAAEAIASLLSQV